MKRKAVGMLVKLLREHLDAMPLQKQIAAYDALAEVMPTKKERASAKVIADLLRTAEKRQMDFANQLFTELQWPGHQHNGPHRKGDGQ